MKLKSKLTGRLCVIGLVSVILTAVSATLAFWFIFSQQAQDDLKTSGTLLASAYDQSAAPSGEALSKIASEEYRITRFPRMEPYYTRATHRRPKTAWTITKNARR